MEGECYASPSASSSTPTTSIGKRKHGRQQNQEKPYRGIRMRKWALHASPGDNSPPNRLLLSEKPDLNEYPENSDEE
ncbi:hypothetical protein D5086_004666 [Populus alba]|uniref:Uncharacterized protein n=1 Tax=Populus alba TaxID=43335 RepID=A0ACC4CRU4_POPAL